MSVHNAARNVLSLCQHGVSSLTHERVLKVAVGVVRAQRTRNHLPLGDQQRLYGWEQRACGNEMNLPAVQVLASSNVQS